MKKIVFTILVLFLTGCITQEYTVKSHDVELASATIGLLIENIRSFHIDIIDGYGQYRPHTNVWLLPLLSSDFGGYPVADPLICRCQNKTSRTPLFQAVFQFVHSLSGHGKISGGVLLGEA